MTPDFRTLPLPLARGWAIALAIRATNSALDRHATLCGMNSSQKVPICRRCDSPLDSAGRCTDETCPFSECAQHDSHGWEGHPSERAYERRTYTLRRFEVIAPHVRNDGMPSGYPEAFARALLAAGFPGWTEHAAHVGVWFGKREAGTRFEVFAPDVHEFGARHTFPLATEPTADVLARIARQAMPDQDAIQLVIGEEVTLHEA